MSRIGKRSNSTESQVRAFSKQKHSYSNKMTAFCKETELPVKKKAKSKENEDATNNESLEKTEEPTQLAVGKQASASASKASLYKPPTFEELQNLKEAEMLFQSNLLKLQVRRRPSVTLTITMFLDH